MSVWAPVWASKARPGVGVWRSGIWRRQQDWQAYVMTDSEGRVLVDDQGRALITFSAVTA